MSKLLSLLCLLLLIFPACKRKLVDNSLPRTEASMSKFQEVLTDAQTGWNVCIITKEGRRWHFWMKFHADGKVEMKGDISKESAVVQSSQFAVRALQQPTLTFATYNHISRLADPDIYGGPTRNVDIQYAFSKDLVKHLRGSGEKILPAFALHGRLHGSKAYFSRVGDNGIITDKSLSIQLKFDSIRWKDSASVNVITKANAVSTGTSGGGGLTTENVFLYDLHTGASGSVYDHVIGVTSFNRKGAAMVYYVDCEGHVRFAPAGSDVKVRKSFVDEEFRKQWTDGYYDDFRWAGGNDTTRLLFTHKSATGESENLAFESKYVSSLNAVLPKLQSHADEDTALFGGRTDADIVNYQFRGFTFRNIRDEWNMRQNGAVHLVWSSRHFA